MLSDGARIAVESEVWASPPVRSNCAHGKENREAKIWQNTRLETRPSPKWRRDCRVWQCSGLRQAERIAQRQAWAAYVYFAADEARPLAIGIPEGWPCLPPATQAEAGRPNLIKVCSPRVSNPCCPTNRI